ncbi:MAG: hypothetical protein JSU70_01195 [Phycisphaerales bacterium]|nr:MAG: hypothetical protein JSU70_01195 [Phycisphaerales bacterium]
MTCSKSFKKGVITVLIVLMVAGSAWAGDAAKPKTKGGMALQVLPAETLFCVMARNLDSAGTAVNEYLEGVAPKSFDAKDEVLSKLAKMLGGEKPAGVDLNGAFVIFGVNLPSKEAPVNPFANVLMGALLQVEDYENFVSGNPNVGEADGDGVSAITMDGRTQAFVTQVGRFAVMSHPGSRANLIRFKNMQTGTGRGLDTVLDESEKESLRSSSIWAYANVQQSSKLFAPLLFAQLEGAKVMLKKAQEQRRTAMADPSAAIDFYGKIIEMLIRGADHVAIGIAPAADKCRFTFQAKAVDGTMLWDLFGAPEYADLSGLLGYLDDGALLNVVTKVDRKGMKLAYMGMIDLLASLSAGALGDADVARIRKMTEKAIDAMGDGLAISMKGGSGTDGPFCLKYVIRVRDEDAFNEIIKEELKMINEGVFDKMYKSFGMEIKAKVETETSAYRGVDIGYAKLSLKMGKEDSPEAQMLNKIWGEGMEYRWAVLDGHCVYAFGVDTGTVVRKLIDQVKVGGPDGLAWEIETAIDVLEVEGEGQEYDFGGTVNYVRLLNMMSGFIAASGGPEIKPLDMSTRSNLVFAGRTADGKLHVETVLPKQHLTELTTAGKKFGEEMDKAVKEQKKKAEERSM